MLLAIDVGNTNVTIGVFDGDRLAHSWRLAALRERTADELGIFVKGLFEQSDVELSTVYGHRARVGRAAADAADGGDGRALLQAEAADRRRHQRRHAGALLAGRRRRRRPHRQRGGGVGAVRPSASRSADRRRLRHRHDLRRHLESRRVSRRRDLSWHQHLRRRAVPARGAPAARRSAQAGAASSARTPSTRCSRALFFGYVEMVDGLVRRIARRARGRRRGGRHRHRRPRRRHLRREPIDPTRRRQT